MASVRSDAARNRARILDAARECAITDLKLNDVARRAGLGVGTVYRHFSNIEALVAALAEGAVEKLRALARTAEREPDPERALAALVRGGLSLQLADAGLQTVLLADASEIPELAGVRAEVMGAAERVLARARDAGVVREDLTLERLLHLVCGIEYAARLGAPGEGELYLDIALAGLYAGRRSPATGTHIAGW